MSTHRFILEPYKGVSTRHTCPACHNKRCFSKYMDMEKQIKFPDYVGRCDHEQKCGYHLTPHDYFEQNPMEKEKLMETDLRQYSKVEETKPIATSFIDANMVERSLHCYPANKLFQFLSSQFGENETLKMMTKYKVGISKHWEGATVFWQIDNQDHTRIGKIILYNSRTGKRVKEPHDHITWVHSLLHKDSYNLKQCFFGEHLLQSENTRPIALVESEKIALIASYYLPQYLWIASGGKNGCFNASNLSALAGRSVILFPDLGATDYWKDKAGLMKSYIIDVQLFDYLETHATEKDRKEGYDIADYLLKIKPNEAILQAMIKKNPVLRKLIETFDLKLVDVQQGTLQKEIPKQKRRGIRF